MTKNKRFKNNGTLIFDNKTPLNTFEVVDKLNELHEENQKMKQKGLKVLEFYINKLKNTNNDIQSVRDEIWIVKHVLYEMGVLDE